MTPEDEKKLREWAWACLRKHYNYEELVKALLDAYNLGVKSKEEKETK